MTTMLDHTEHGDSKAFLDRDLMKYVKQETHTGGVMDALFKLSRHYDFMELVWNYYYYGLLGKTPQNLIY